MYQSRFQLLDEGWIPVQDRAGQITEVSLLDAFTRAGEWVRVAHESPLVTISIYRLLFAIYQRSVSVSHLDERSEIWDKGGCHQDVPDYLERWRHRFDLLDEVAPFWQIADMSTDLGSMSWAKLAADLNDKNNKVLFDHTTIGSAGGTDLANAARLLVACQMMSVGAGKSSTGYNINADLATKLVAIPEGDSLADTLIINLMADSPEDRPIWEQDLPTAAQIADANDKKLQFSWFGPASKSTWLTRCIRIFVSEEDGLVHTIAFAAGLRPVADGNYRDPWVAHRLTDKSALVPQRLEPTESIWRELHAVLVQGDDGWETPEIVGALVDFGSDEVNRPPPESWTLLVGGQAADKAKIEGWGQERWRVPRRILEASLHRGACVKECIKRADETASSVERISWTVANYLLSIGGDADKSQVKRLANRIPAADEFWASLERPFGTLLEILGGQDDDAIDLAREFWNSSLIDALRTAESSAYSFIGRGTGALKAWAKAGPRFRSLILSCTTKVRNQDGATG